MQKRPEWCSAAAVQNALRVLGKRTSQAAIADSIKIGDCPEGCDHSDCGADERGVMRGLESVGATWTVLETSRRRDAYLWLGLASQQPLILCVDRWQHWVVVAGRCGDRLYMLDSWPERYNLAHNGTLPLRRKTILRRWRASRWQRVDGAPYYGLAISIQ